MRLFYDIVLYFFLFGFCGWLCECVYCSIHERKFINRGFVNGPVCPIYSIGGLMVVYILAPVQNHIALLFLLGAACTTALEYITSYVLEKLFSTSWWDYSDIPFNLNGRVCLPFSMAFGALSVVGVKVLFAPFTEMVAWIPYAAKPWLAWGLIAVFTADCAVTVHTILSLNGRLAEFSRLAAELRQRLETMQEESLSFAERLEQFKAAEHKLPGSKALEGLVERFENYSENVIKRRRHRRLLSAFPKMKSKRYPEQLLALKKAFSGLRDKAKIKK